VNLDVELTRSRRISCSCCGLKGAALGCYNKSCKNSFHVTCAKLIPECRWDNVSVAYIVEALYSPLHSSFNTFSYQQVKFVMLCPLDASIKLPCEEANSKDRKCKRTPKEYAILSTDKDYDVIPIFEIRQLTIDHCFL